MRHSTVCCVSHSSLSRCERLNARDRGLRAGQWMVRATPQRAATCPMNAQDAAREMRRRHVTSRRGRPRTTSDDTERTVVAFGQPAGRAVGGSPPSLRPHALCFFARGFGVRRRARKRARRHSGCMWLRWDRRREHPAGASNSTASVLLYAGIVELLVHDCMHAREKQDQPEGTLARCVLLSCRGDAARRRSPRSVLFHSPPSPPRWQPRATRMTARARCASPSSRRRVE